MQRKIRRNNAQSHAVGKAIPICRHRRFESGIGIDISSPSSLERNHPQILSKPRNRQGFTLVELLVTVTIIIVLASIAFSISKSTRLNASKVTDMRNLRSLSAAAMAGGSDNAGRLPTIHPANQSAPYWLQSREILESYGITKESCYAPTRDIHGGAPGFAWWHNYGASTPTHYV